ncbi:MAG: hypothetical protein IMY86_03060 [Chloroflexi bacterium]|nr:hypothetical protein [Chloroflexota bacterium]
MTTCAACGVEIPAGQEIVLRGKDKNAPPVTVCPNCAKAVERAFQAEAESPNLMGALLFGLGAAVVSSLVWYGIVAITHYQLGFIAVGVGWLVGTAVRLGAGRKRGMALQITSVLITLITMAVSEYFIVRYFAMQALVEEGYTGIPLLLPADLMVQLIVEGIKSEPVTLLFWGIAAWEAFAIPAKRRLQRAR